MKVKISKLVNNTGQIPQVPANPRQISKDDYQKLLKSLQEDPEFLEHKPLHVYPLEDKYIVLGGNQRLRALKELGYSEVPVTIYAADTPAKVLKARMIKDNSEYGKYDWDMLANEWPEEPLTDWGVDLPDEWLDGEPEITEDEAPEIDETTPPKSKLGEVYQLGRHRLMAGDATKREDVDKLMNGEKADMVFTDPPYALFGNSTGISGVADDKMVRPFFLAVGNTLKKASKANAHIYSCLDWKSYTPVVEEYSNAGILLKNVIVWDKGNVGLGVNYRNQYEWVLYLHNYTEDFGKTVRKKGSDVRITDTNLWTIKREKDGNHNAQKPTELVSRAVKNSSAENEIVLDVFGGSGSTLIACEQTNRTCYMMEIDPKYIDVIRKRYHKFVTGDEEGWEEGTPAL